jgi:Secretion system C-terminal sorting domain/Family of unknown function (DUF5689)/Endonuclease/Exonuclease/phosphatase family
MSNKFIQQLLCAGVLLFSLNFSFAQINLATWTFENVATVTTKAANVTASDVSLSTGTIGYSAGITGQAISGSSWSTTTTLGKYFEFTIAPADNFLISLSSITFASQISTTGPTAWALRSSVDNYTTNLATGTNPLALATQAANLGTAIQNRNTAVTFRLYGYSASSTGTFRIDDLMINGTATTNFPNITLSKTTMNFGNVGQNSVSAIQTYTITGRNLTSNVVLNITNGFTFSTTPTGTFDAMLNLMPTAGSVDATIYVKEPTNNLGAVSGSITHTNPLTMTQTITLSGNINAPLSGFTSVAASRTAANGTAVTIQGYVTVSSQFGANQMFIQDETGGISIFNGAENLSEVYGLQIGDFVQLSGTKGSFNSLAQINTPLTFQKNTTPPSVQTPITITSSQMSAYEGQLVRIVDLPNPAGPTTLVANTNYTFNTTQIRILGTINAPYSNNLVATTLGTGTSNITGVVGRFNSTYQLQPRFLTDIENVNSLPFYGPDLAFSTNTTLDVGCWNMEWFGHPTLGPSNNTLQKTNVTTVMNTLNLDVLNANEISDDALLGQAVAALGSNFSYTCSQEVSNGTLAMDPNAQRVCFIYKNTVLSNVTTTALLLDVKANPTAFFPNATLGYPAYPQADPTNFWASGRLPYAMTADVTIGGVTRRMMFVGLHGKANTAPTDIAYQRRQLDARVLKDYLDRDFPNIPFIVMGDYNDDVDVSIYDNVSASSYKNFVDDAARYRFLTGQTSLTGRNKSTVGFSAMIDHVMVSNEVFSAYEANSARVGLPEFYINNYGTTTVTDHYPVMARFNISNITLPVTLIDFKANFTQNNTVNLRWDVADEINLKHYLLEKSSNGRDFVPFNMLKAENANVYKTTDEQPYVGTTYYRLKMVDNDASFEYSKVISVDKKSLNKTLKVYPNPASNVFFVENIESLRNPATGGTEGPLVDRILILNLNGQVVKTETNTNKINVSDLSNGLYILEVQLKDKSVLREKIIKN